MFNSVYDSLTIISSTPYMIILKDHWNKHQNTLFQFNLVKFLYLLNLVGTCIFYTFQWKPDISHLISSKPTVIKWVYCQNFSVTEWLNCNTMKVWKTSTKRIYSVISQLTGNAYTNQMASCKDQSRGDYFFFLNYKIKCYQARERGLNILGTNSNHFVSLHPRMSHLCSSFPCRSITGRST